MYISVHYRNHVWSIYRKLGINRWPQEKMADEKNAEVVSGEEKIADEDNESVMSDGLMQIFKPAVQELDEKLLSVRYD